MTRASRAACRALTVCAVLLLLGVPAWAQQPPPSSAEPPLPFAPAWASLAGWDVFARKGCGRCHGIRGTESRVGPDLARIRSGTGFWELGATLWNHLPRMGERMRQMGIDRPRFTPLEISNLLAFLFTAQYWDELGQAEVGERLFAAKGCATCHRVGGKGGEVGPALDALKRANSPVIVAAKMWNHGPRMAEAMLARGIERPDFQGRQLVDIIAYIVAAAQEPGGETAQVVPGTPERGQKLFRDKHCAVCHAVGGRGGGIGPELGRAHHVSLTEFAALMWNHGPVMWERMKARGIAVPELTGQEMADIVAYLYTAHYFDAKRGSAARGQDTVQRKGCLACHAVRGKGGTVGADFATSRLVTTHAGLLAGMWNHSRYMEAQAQKQAIVLPTLTAQELADISAYFISLGRAGAAKRPAKSTR